MTKANFEKGTGFGFPQYEVIDQDSRIVWWIVSRDGEKTPVEIPRREKGDRSSAGGACFPVKSSTLEISCDAGKISFSLKGN
jgi:hypothetical protein